MARDILLEIGTEEIPANFMSDALKQLEILMKAKLDEARISFSSLRAIGTPRRMAVIARAVSELQQDVKTESRGPSLKIAFDATGKPTRAAQGFARGQGVDVDTLLSRDGYVYAVKDEHGKPVEGLLPQLMTDVIASLNFPKTMHWADLDFKFVRPIRWLVALYGQDVVPFSIAGVVSGNKTRGHRFLSAGELEVPAATEYEKVLQDNFVIVDQELRCRLIKEQIMALAAKAGGKAAIDKDLLEEVVYLVEYPTALCGRFEERYLDLPQEAVITPMRDHQRYFPVFAADGKLLPVFITVRNGSAEHIATVQHGNERVLRARLADAEFFFDEDKKTTLAARIEKLKSIVFQDGLGTLYDKSKRIAAIADGIADCLVGEHIDRDKLTRTAQLCKTDLMTNMVCEFTELQGVMGREYALLDGEDKAVATAIYEHYLPRFAGDSLPGTDLGRIISIADKVDNIVATFSRGLIPTGSQDPYALRRQALGIVNTLIEAQWDISLSAIIAKAAVLLTDDAAAGKQLQQDVQEFLDVRLKGILMDAGINYDVVDAVMAASTADVYDVWLRADAMQKQSGTAAMQTAVQAFTRVGNLIKTPVRTAVAAEHFTAAEEQKLYAAYLTANEKIAGMKAAKDYEAILQVMAELTQPIDAFFAAVMVMVDDEKVRNNRLALLQAITSLTYGIIDFKKIVAA